jgi:hypothetical protein
VREISNGSPGCCIFDCVIPRFDTPAFKRCCLSCCDDPSQLSALPSVSKDSPRAPEAVPQLLTSAAERLSPLDGVALAQRWAPFLCGAVRRLKQSSTSPVP